MYMRYLEVWSPLKWLHVRFFVSDEGDWFIKIGQRKRAVLPTVTSALMVLKRWFLRHVL